MRHHNRFSWMIRPRGFIKLLGAEYDLMQKAGSNVLVKFYASSILIVITGLLTFLSVRYAIDLLFHVLAVEITLSIFISLLFMIMYIFLINTFSKELRERKIYNLSNVSRIGFVVFMGFIISKPIETYIYKDELNTEVATYKQQLFLDHVQKINSLYNLDVSELASQKQAYEKFNRDSIFAPEIENISKRIEAVNKKRDELISSSEFRIRNAAYFIYQVRSVVGKHPTSWLVCLGIISLFLLPGLIIYLISKDDEYFKLKSSQEKRMIQNAYDAFLEKYTSLFKRYKLEISFYSKYEDPPFNTQLKIAPKSKSTTDFHNKYGFK